MTTASSAGIPETTIKQLGRWNSMAYQQYIRPSTDSLALMAGQLASGQPQVATSKEASR